MKILVLSPVYPYPPEDGDRIRIYNMMKCLSKKHELHLVSFEGPSSKSAGVFRSETIVPISAPEKGLNTLKGIFSGEPLNITAYDSAAMLDEVKKAYDRIKPELIYCYRLRMSPYAEALPAPRVIDIVDSLALYNKRRRAYEKNMVRKAYIALDLPRLLKKEKSLEAGYESVFINSGDDASFLGLKNVMVVSNGAARAVKRRAVKDGFIAGFLGNMEYAPNLDAARFYMRKIWKKTLDSDKNIKMVIAGDAKGLLKDFDGRDNTEVKGKLPDIYAEMGLWSVSVVPVRYGAGRQNKILDSWAAMVPVVSTSFAAGGVYGKHGVNMLIADTPEDFSAAVLKIKNSPELALKLVAGGVDTLKKHFNWEKNMKAVLKAV